MLFFYHTTECFYTHTNAIKNFIKLTFNMFVHRNGNGTDAMVIFLCTNTLELFHYIGTFGRYL